MSQSAPHYDFANFETKYFLVFFVLCKIRFKYFSEKAIKRYQNKRVQIITRQALANSEFFKNHYKNFDINKFFSLPTVNKKK